MQQPASDRIRHVTTSFWLLFILKSNDYLHRSRGWPKQSKGRYTLPVRTGRIYCQYVSSLTRNEFEPIDLKGQRKGQTMIRQEKVCCSLWDEGHSNFGINGWTIGLGGLLSQQRTFNLLFCKHSVFVWCKSRLFTTSGQVPAFIHRVSQKCKPPPNYVI